MRRGASSLADPVLYSAARLSSNDLTNAPRYVNIDGFQLRRDYDYKLLTPNVVHNSMLTE